jgi:hypothetical protein
MPGAATSSPSPKRGGGQREGLTAPACQPGSCAAPLLPCSPAPCISPHWHPSCTNWHATPVYAAAASAAGVWQELICLVRATCEAVVLCKEVW